MKRLDETKWPRPSTRPETFLVETETRPRRWAFWSRRDRDETLTRLETVSRPRRRDRDHIPVISNRSLLILILLLLLLFGRRSSKSPRLDPSLKIGLGGRSVLQVNKAYASIDEVGLLMTSYFQAGGHDVHQPAARYPAKRA